MKVTESAKARLKEVLKSEEYLEVGLSAGGCGGATVELTRRDSKSTEGLSIGENTNVKFADEISSEYLTGGTLDYRSDILGSTFVVSPPSEVSSCGCGESIQLERKGR